MPLISGSPVSANRSIAVLESDEVHFEVQRFSEDNPSGCYVQFMCRDDTHRLPVAEGDLAIRLRSVGQGPCTASDVGLTPTDRLLVVLAVDADAASGSLVSCAAVLAVDPHTYEAGVGILSQLPHRTSPTEVTPEPNSSSSSRPDASANEATDVPVAAPTRQPRLWMGREIAELKARWEEGATLGELAGYFRRTRIDVGARLIQLGFDPAVRRVSRWGDDEEPTAADQAPAGKPQSSGSVDE